MIMQPLSGPEPLQQNTPERPGLMPLLFVGHGSPMNAVQTNDFTESLRSAGGQLPHPRLILCISAHWVTEGTFVTGSARPKQIYDFSGFPEELYDIVYAPAGSPGDARQVATLGKDIPVVLDAGWGIDHGAWAVLKHLYPKQDIPVVQLSLDGRLDEQAHYRLAGFLQPLRSDGVLIVGSGNIVHNLGRMSGRQFGEEPYRWARAFDEQVKDALARKDDELLARYDSRDREAGALSVPTNEHYLPLLYVAALRGPTETVRYFHEGFQHRSVSMRSFVIT
jgi:4,5-DOPA dioxygenase extradiol